MAGLEWSAMPRELTNAAPVDGVLIQSCVSAAAGACDIDH